MQILFFVSLLLFYVASFFIAGRMPWVFTIYSVCLKKQDVLNEKVISGIISFCVGVIFSIFVFIKCNINIPFILDEGFDLYKEIFFILFVINLLVAFYKDIIFYERFGAPINDPLSREVIIHFFQKIIKKFNYSG